MYKKVSIFFHSGLYKGKIPGKIKMENKNNSFGLYRLLFERLNELKTKYHKEIISFPHLFEKICRNFSINKKQAWELLFILREFGFIEIIAGHGIKIIGNFD